MNILDQKASARWTWWIPLLLGGYLILFLGGSFALSTLAAIAVFLACLLVARSGRFFSVEGYLCVLSIYYWLGIANPFHADVHGVDLRHAIIQKVLVLVVVGSALLWWGALQGRRLASRRTGPLASVRSRDDPAVLKRAWMASLVLLSAGCLVAVLCYVRFGIPALADNQGQARAAFVQALSPYTYYQWLLVEVGIGLAAFVLANDRDSNNSPRRWILFAAGCGALIVLAGVTSRVTLATPVVLGAIVWWSQGRRIPWYAVTAGALGAILVIGLIWIVRTQALGSVTVYGVEFDLGGGPWQGLRTVTAALSIFARTSIEVFAMFVRGDLPKLHGEIAFMSVIALLPGKQSDLGLFNISKLLGYDTSQGTTVSLFGGMYGDFGAAGILLLAPLLGAALGYGERRARESDGLGGLYYGVTLSYYLNMIYGGQLLDATLLWKLWLCLLVVRCIRTGHLARTRFGIAQAGTTFALYGYGLLQLVLG